MVFAYLGGALLLVGGTIAYFRNLDAKWAPQRENLLAELTELKAIGDGITAEQTARIAEIGEQLPGPMGAQSQFLGAVIIVSIVIGFISLAVYRRVNVYESFIEGAKEGFHVAVKIIPYLVAMLIAIGVFRASGAMGYLISLFRFVFSPFGDTRWVDALPVALMKPLSGGGGPRCRCRRDANVRSGFLRRYPRQHDAGIHRDDLLHAGGLFRSGGSGANPVYRRRRTDCRFRGHCRSDPHGVYFLWSSMMDEIVKHIGEDELVSRLIAEIDQSDSVVVGPGDDCAVIDSDPESEFLQLLKTDCIVESIHFDSETDPILVGWKAVCRVLSDLAAMGGQPDHALVTVAVDQERPVRDVVGWYQGIQESGPRIGRLSHRRGRNDFAPEPRCLDFRGDDGSSWPGKLRDPHGSLAGRSHPGDRSTGRLFREWPASQVHPSSPPRRLARVAAERNPPHGDDGHQ